MGSCIALMSVRFGAPDYYPGFSTAAIRRFSISRNKFLPGTHLLHLGGVECGKCTCRSMSCQRTLVHVYVAISLLFDYHYLFFFLCNLRMTLYHPCSCCWPRVRRRGRGRVHSQQPIPVKIRAKVLQVNPTKWPHSTQRECQQQQ